MRLLRILAVLAMLPLAGGMATKIIANAAYSAAHEGSDHDHECLTPAC